MAYRTERFDTHTIRRIAAEADRDPRSVVEALSGRGHSTTRESVRKAMLRLGLGPPIDAPATGANTDRGDMAPPAAKEVGRVGA